MYPDHARLLVVRNHQGEETPVTRVVDWQVRRSHVLSHVQEVMGPLPGGERRVLLDLAVIEEHEEPAYIRKKVTFATEPGDRVPAWLLVPKSERQTHPAVLCLHQTIPIGKDEPAGLGSNPDLAYARELAERGFVALAPDYVRFGDHQPDPYALGYASASMKGIWDHMRAVDLLESLPEVDPTRIGAIGHSLGGHNALFLAAFDPRIRAVVTSCGFTSFPRYYQGNIAGWSHAGYMPRLKDVYELKVDRVPFDFPELLGSIAPRAVFINAPTRDDNFDLQGVKDCVTAARGVYSLFGEDRRLVLETPDAGHAFPPEIRDKAYEFLTERLTPRTAAGARAPTDGDTDHDPSIRR